MRNRILILLSGFLLLLSPIYITPSFVTAKSISDIDRKIKELDEKQKKLQQNERSIQQKKSNTSEKIRKNKQEQSSIQSEISTLDKSISETEQKIATKESEITSLQGEISSLEQKVTEIETEIAELHDQIDQLNEEVEEVTERMERREGILRERLRSMHFSGGSVTFLEVLFGAKNFTDLISRVTAVNTIMKQDKVLIEEHQEDKLTLEANRKQVQENRDQLQENRTELVAKKEEIEETKQQVEEEKSNLLALKHDLASQSKEKESLLAKLQQEEKVLREYEISLEEEQKVIAAQAAAIERAKQLEQEEKKRLQQLGNQAGNNEYNPKGDKIFLRPTTGKYSSGFGMRFHPIYEDYRMHYGTDIANSAGTRVNAAAPGIVTHAGWLSDYGRTVIITHSINGVTYATLYAHLNRISVTNGQMVKAGAQIGLMGSTGNSTGPHLHFEVHKGGYAGYGENAVNPMPYIINP